MLKVLPYQKKKILSLSVQDVYPKYSTFILKILRIRILKINT